MRTKIISVLVLGAFVFSAYAVAVPKIGYVDLHKTLQSIDAGKKAKKKLEKEISSKQKALEKEQVSLQKEAETFEKRSAILNASKRAEQQANLQKKFYAFQKKAAESQLQLQKREQELTQPILKELKVIVEGHGKKGNYDLILEKSEGSVLYARAGSDLTNEIIKLANKKKRKK